MQYFLLTVVGGVRLGDRGEHLIERMTWQEVEAQIEAGVDAVLLPIGTTEQHGPHMPLDTDCVIAQGLATRAAELAAEQEGSECSSRPR